MRVTVPAAWCGLIASAWVCATAATGASYVSRGAYTGDWASAGTWTNGAGAWPGEGDDVQIASPGSVVIVSGPTSNLNSLTISRTLVFTNWNSAVRAFAVSLLGGGTLSLPAAFTNSGPSNNILIVCGSLSIAAGASINADARGYAARLDFSGPAGTRVSAYGHGPGAGYGFGGGGYGGRGGGVENWANTLFGLGGAACSDAAAPNAPGSAGGTAYYGGYAAGSGGGAVRIEAAGAVVVNGTISANGGDGSSAGSGSGGGIYITCHTLAGTGGIIRANGGGAYGGGGGGRIAVHYDPAAQAARPVPGIMFSALPGLGNSAYGFGDVGTLFFPDNRFLTNPFTHFGQWCVPGFTNWATDGWVVSNGWLRLPDEGFHLAVSNRLLVVGTDPIRHKLELTNGVLTVGGDAVVSRATLNLFGGSAVRRPIFDCGGSLLLTNGASLSIYSGPTSGVAAAEWGAGICITGAVHVATNSSLYVSAHPTNGGAAWIRAGEVRVAPGGVIGADGRGFAGRERAAGWGPGGGSGYQGGGGHGGRGGQLGSSVRGSPYGEATAPLLPGSAGGAWLASSGHVGCSGGGLIRIEAAGTLALNGTISADGAASGPKGTTWGAGSGGGIHVICRTWTGSGGVMRARGGSGTYVNGGGGRIAVWRSIDTATGMVADVSPGATALGDAPGTGTVYWGSIALPRGAAVTVR